jgi:hypothetical protein
MFVVGFWREAAPKIYRAIRRGMKMMKISELPAIAVI